MFQVLNEEASNTSSTHSDLYEMTWLPHRGSHTSLPRGAGSEGDPETGKWGWVGVSVGELRGEGHHPSFGVPRVCPHLHTFCHEQLVTLCVLALRGVQIMMPTSWGSVMFKMR